MEKTAAELLMERETRVAYGAVPRSLGPDPLPPSSWQLVGDEFLLRAEGEHYFHYRRREGITVERGAGAIVDEEPLWLDGSVYSAIASINGLLPLHASAVTAGGRVFAFTGPAGSGKSTLVAALGRLGFPMFCDDTLLLDVGNPAQLTCLPGHKRLKLTAAALELTGAHADGPVSPSVPKFYAVPSAGTVERAMPLAALVFIENGARAKIAAIAGADRFARLEDDHYTSALFTAARRLDRPAQFALRSRIARQVAMARFRRPHDAAMFEEGVTLAAHYINEAG
jgi:hypothetical protein